MAQTGALWALIRQPLAPGQGPLSAESDSDAAENISAEPEWQPGENSHLLNLLLFVLAEPGGWLWITQHGLLTPVPVRGSGPPSVCGAEPVSGAGDPHSQRDSGTLLAASPSSPSLPGEGVWNVPADMGTFPVSTGEGVSHLFPLPGNGSQGISSPGLPCSPWAGHRRGSLWGN